MARSRIVAERRDLDDQTIDRARGGDQRAWTEIVTVLGPMVRGFARAKGVQDPDDLTQEVFIAAARGLDGFAGDQDAFRSWVFTIAYRRVVDRWRKKDPKTTELSPGLVDHSSPTPEDVVVRRSTAEDALAAADVLSPIERDVILLRVLTGMETKEVAQVIGKRPGNVRVIQARALKKLKAELERRGYGSDESVSAGRMKAI